MVCPRITDEDDSTYILSSYNRSVGTNVLIGCKPFGYRFSGPNNVTCLANNTWSELLEYKCAWTGELNTYEKLVIGTAAGCAGLLLMCLVAIFCFAYINDAHKKLRKEKQTSHRQYSQFDPPHRDHTYQNSNDYIRQSGPYADKIYPYDDPSDGYRRSHIDDSNGYIIYTGRKENKFDRKSNHMYENRAYDNNEHRSYDSKHDRNVPVWNGQIPRPQVRESRLYH